MPSPNESVVVEVDRETYASGDAVVATVRNRLQTSLFTTGGKATCSIFGLQVQVADAWRGAGVARCPHGRVSPPIEVKSGEVYSARIVAGYPGFKAATFPPGIYRLVLTYSLANAHTSELRGLGQQLMTVYSQTFDVTHR